MNYFLKANKNLITYALIILIVIPIFGINFFLSFLGNIILLLFLIPLLLLLLIFVGINEKEEDMRVVWFTKEDFNNHKKSDNSLFNVQQGGKSVGNDDYICTKVESLLQCDWVKSIDLW